MAKIIHGKKQCWAIIINMNEPLVVMGAVLTIHSHNFQNNQKVNFGI
jgi:hypothetical protein